MAHKTDPNSPYKGMRGGWLGGGRPKKTVVTDRKISVRIPLESFWRVIHTGESMSNYIRRLITEDEARLNAAKNAGGETQESDKV